MSVVMPAKYVGAPLEQPAASSGRDLLQPNQQMIRSVIGGRRRIQRNKTKRQRKGKSKKQQRQQKGGFVPSIGEPFVAAVGKYIAPLALYGLYKFINKSKTRKSKRRV
jgi:hypothetical protein